MGTYKVKDDGKAPEGLSLGDLVITGGGSYLITGFKEDGSYKSRLVDSSTTTANYKGNYDSAPAGEGSYSELLRLFREQIQGAASSAGSSGSSSGNGSGESSGATGKSTGNIISLEEALKQAKAALTPQYEAAAKASAGEAAQKLEKAGLYDTVYGQALAASSSNDMAESLNTAVAKLALELQEAAGEQQKAAAEQQLKEKQLSAEERSTALKYLLSLLQG